MARSASSPTITSPLTARCQRQFRLPKGIRNGTITIAIRGLTLQKTEGGLAVPAVLLVVITNYQGEMRLLHIPINFPLFGFNVALGTVATTVSLLIITVMLLMRFFASQRQKEVWKLEIQQAQHVQQILIPNKLPEIPGFTIDSKYRSAREVGGDFLQVLPGDLPSSVLIVVGDVTGECMQAGMLVAVIVGALRAAALHSSILLGFDRINELLKKTSTAQAIAQAAQDFGQEDDILVLQVRRNRVQLA